MPAAITNVLEAHARELESRCDRLEAQVKALCEAIDLAAECVARRRIDPSTVHETTVFRAIDAAHELARKVRET